MNIIDRILGRDKKATKSIKDNIIVCREKSVKELSDVNSRLLTIIEAGRIESVVEKLDIIRKE